MMKQTTVAEVLRYRATEELIKWSKSKRTLLTDPLRNAFEAYFAATNNTHHKSEKEIWEQRKKSSETILKSCVPTLDKLQFLKAESAIKEIVADFKLNLSLKR